MAKRFTDNGIWKRAWFRKLKPEEKAAWFYIKDECDAVGVWTPDYELADFMIGVPVDWNSLPEKMNGNVEIMDNGKWFLVDFCLFQYGILKADIKNKPHASYVKLLRHYGLLDRVLIDYKEGMHTLKDKEKEKEKDKEKDKDKDPSSLSTEDNKDERGKTTNPDYTPEFEEFWNLYPKRVAKGAAARVWKRDKCKRVLPEILAALAHYKRSEQWTKDNGQFIPHASTWLHARCYDDDLTVNPPRSLYDRKLG